MGLKIAINTRFLIKGKLEGIGRFSNEIVKRLVQNYPEHHFYLLFDREWDQEFIFGKNVTPVKVSPQARHPVLWKIWYEISLPKALNKIQPDIFVSLDGYTSLRAKFPKITVMHDLAFEHFPRDIPGSVARYMKKYGPKYAEKSDLLVAVSEATKKDLMESYAISEDKIKVVYNSVRKDFADLGDDVEIESIVGEDRYFLYVGSIHPRKNVGNLLLAYDQFRNSDFRKFKLVIAGRKAWDYREVEEIYREMKYRKDVIFTDFLEEKQLSALYSAAFASVYVSYFEGFGIPIIESQLCGCPVITSNVSSMPEVAGAGAILVDPFKVKSIASGLGEMVNVPGLRNSLITKGVENVNRFSWDESAKKMMGLIKQVTKSE